MVNTRFMKRTAILGLFFLPVCIFSQIPSEARQVLVAVADNWSTHRATLQCWERDRAGDAWRPVDGFGWPVLLGRKGMAWGKGVFQPTNPDIPWKVEKDGKAPAGVFQLGRIYGEQPKLPAGAVWPYHQIGPYDAWVDDPRLPQYNQHVRVIPGQIPSWFDSQRMRLGDSAYKWLVEIRHNRGPIEPGYGSAIFFHVRRGPDRPSSGCTTMELANLEKLIRWIRVEKQPYYVLLPKEEYAKVRHNWRLP